MTSIIPFRGLLYNPSKVSLADVIAPPYDIITPEMQEELYLRSNFNIVKIDYGKVYPDDDDEKTNKYERASAYLKKWINEGIIEFTEKPAYYVYESTYHVNSNQKKMRGIFGAVKLVDLCNGIFPHEETYSKPKSDRLSLMHSCHANLSPIFSIYNNPKSRTSDIINKIVDQAPYLKAEDDFGTFHKCWIIDREDYISTINKDFTGIDIFIADGHHRYETALEYKKQLSKNYSVKSTHKDPDYVLMLLINIYDGGFTILPTHRLIKNIPENPLSILESYFTIEHIKHNLNILEVISSHKNSFGLVLSKKEGFFVLRYNGKDFSDRDHINEDIGIMILHELIFKKLYNVRDFGYEMDIGKAFNKTKSGEYEAAFFLNPTRVEDIEKVSKAGLRMPPKSTYFYPKIPTGLVINPFQD